MLRAVGCEAPWWSKKHQRFSGTQRRAYEEEKIQVESLNLSLLIMPKIRTKYGEELLVSKLPSSGTNFHMTAKLFKQ